jgi:hypothetical protein
MFVKSKYYELDMFVFVLGCKTTHRVIDFILLTWNFALKMSKRYKILILLCD